MPIVFKRVVILFGQVGSLANTALNPRSMFAPWSHRQSRRPVR